jgi:hypothetical protein
MLGQNLDKVWEMARNSQALWDTFQQQNGAPDTKGDDGGSSASGYGECQDWSELDANNMSVYLRYLTFSDNDLLPAGQLSGGQAQRLDLSAYDHQHSLRKAPHDKHLTNRSLSYASPWPDNTFNSAESSQPISASVILRNCLGNEPVEPR